MIDYKNTFRESTKKTESWDFLKNVWKQNASIEKRRLKLLNQKNSKIRSFMSHRPKLSRTTTRQNRRKKRLWMTISSSRNEMKKIQRKARIRTAFNLSIREGFWNSLFGTIIRCTVYISKTNSKKKTKSASEKNSNRCHRECDSTIRSREIHAIEPQVFYWRFETQSLGNLSQRDRDL